VYRVCPKMHANFVHVRTSWGSVHWFLVWVKTDDTVKQAGQTATISTLLPMDPFEYGRYEQQDVPEIVD